MNEESSAHSFSLREPPMRDARCGDLALIRRGGGWMWIREKRRAESSFETCHNKGSWSCSKVGGETDPWRF